MNRAAWILAGLFVVLVVVIIFMFGDDEGGETTTIPGETTTSVAGGTTSPEATTTVPPPTTSTSAESTTTTEGTTTTAGLEGNWAGDPVVVAGFGALGWWDGSVWVQVEAGSDLPLTGSEDYQVAAVGVQAVTTGSGPTTLCEPLQNPGVVLEDEQLLGDFPGPYGVAISASPCASVIAAKSRAPPRAWCCLRGRRLRRRSCRGLCAITRSRKPTGRWPSRWSG